MSITLRPYQIEASNDAIESMVSRGVSFCLCLPAQTGKTITVFEIVRKMMLKFRGLVTLFVTPRKFITKQGSEEAESFFDEMSVGYINSTVNTEKQIEKQVKNKSIVVADLKTIINRLKSNPYLINIFKLLVIDEAHYSNKKENQKSKSLVEELRELMKHCYQLGVTATPHDENGKYIDTYDVIYDKFNTEYMVKNGYLAETIVYQASIYNSNSSNKKAYSDYQNTLRRGVNGEITAGSLAKATNSKAGKILTESMISTSLKDKIIFRGERALVYTGSIEQSERVLQAYRTNGIKAVAVHSKAKDSLRLVNEFNQGVHDVLISVDMLIMGVVIKNIKKSLFFRDIGSWITYIQVWNRGRGGDKSQTRIPNKLYFFTETYSKKGHADDFRPHNNDKEEKLPSVCVKCKTPKKDHQEIIKEHIDNGFSFVQKRCIVCGLIEESNRVMEKQNLYDGSFNLVPAERKKVMKEKIKVKKADYYINDSILKIENKLRAKQIDEVSVKKIVSYLNANSLSNMNRDRNYLNNVYKFVSANSRENVIKNIVKTIKVK